MKFYTTSDQITQDLLDLLNTYYPFVFSIATDIQRFGNNELRVTTNDYKIIIFDKITMTVRMIDPETYDHSDEWLKSFSSRLKALLKVRGVTQRELAYRTGLSEINISAYLNCKYGPSAYNAKKIADALGCNIAELMCCD